LSDWQPFILSCDESLPPYQKPPGLLRATFEVATSTYLKKNTRDQIDARTFVPANSRIAGELGDPFAYNSPRRVAVGVRASF